MRRFLPFCLLLLVFLPINFTGGYAWGKPLDFVPSDLLLLLVPLVLFYFGRLNSSGLAKNYTLALMVYLSYCVLDILVLQLEGEGGLVSVASFARAVRPFFLFYVGFMLFHWSNGRAERWALHGAVALPFILLLSDVAFSPHFPSPRWGGYFFEMDVYGFPNSPGFFYVVAFALLLSKATISGSSRWIFAFASIIAALIIAFIGSRNALISLSIIVLLLLYLKYLDRRYIFAFVPLIAIGIYITLAADLDVGLLASKAQRTVDEGLLYGRLGVWEEVLTVVAERPIFGYGFEPLTANYSFHGTAHNQYIEYLYKTGLLGTVLISFVWLLVFRAYYVASKHPMGGLENRFYAFLLVAFIACLVSNFAQPNLSYSITQTFFVFFAGVASARVASLNRKMARA